MAIEPGDLFWEGPRRNAAKTAPLDGDGKIPDSAALPTVARWLAETPDAARAMSVAVEAISALMTYDGEYGRFFSAEFKAEHARATDVIRALLAALEPTP